MPLGQNAKAVLEQVSTATITTILLKKGLRNVWMRGPQALNRISRGSWGAFHAPLRAGARGSGDARLMRCCE